MGTTAKNREFLVLAGLIAGAAAALLLFRDGIGIVVFLALVVATLIQLVRVALGSGKSKTLGQLWAALKDAFWGIG